MIFKFSLWNTARVEKRATGVYVGERIGSEQFVE